MGQFTFLTSVYVQMNSSLARNLPYPDMAGLDNAISLRISFARLIEIYRDIWIYSSRVGISSERALVGSGSGTET